MRCRWCSCAEEEISEMRRELDKYGINMPSFGKIGGILATQVIMFFIAYCRD